MASRVVDPDADLLTAPLVSEPQSATPMHNKRPERIGAIVARLIDGSPWSKQVEELQALGRWREIVGLQIARQAQPESLKDGVLMVRVQNSVWLSHLRFLAEELRGKLNREIPSAPIREIRFRLGSVDPTSPSI